MTRGTLLVVFGSFMLLASANRLLAQNPIVVKLDGTTISTHASGADITINLGDYTGDHEIHIYDSTLTDGAPDDSIGKVTINGRVPLDTDGSRCGVAGRRCDELRVMIAASTESFPAFNPQFQTLPGAVNFGGSGTGAGLVIKDPNNSSDDSLARATRLCLAVDGDVTGQVARLPRATITSALRRDRAPQPLCARARSSRQSP